METEVVMSRDAVSKAPCAHGDALTFQRFESTTPLTAEGQSQTFTVTAELLDQDADACRVAIDAAAADLGVAG